MANAGCLDGDASTAGEARVALTPESLGASRLGNRLSEGFKAATLRPRLIASRISGGKGERLSGSSCHNGTIIHRPMPIMIDDITISIRSVVGHQGVRVAGSVMSLLPTPYWARNSAKSVN